MVCLVFELAQGHDRYDYILKNDGLEYKARYLKVSRGFSLNLEFGAGPLQYGAAGQIWWGWWC